VILVVSFPEDEHTRDVIERLRERGRSVRLLDLVQIPIHRSMALEWGRDDPTPRQRHLDADDDPIDLDEVGAVWWRRVRPFSVDPMIREQTPRAFALSETAQAVYGLLDSLDRPWMNPRLADEAAHHKPLQWAVARSVGLAIPRTLVTTVPDEARRFIEEVGFGKVVCKAFLASLDAWRETRLVTADDMTRLDLVRLAPVIFQEYVPGVDLRITIVGEQLFAGAIDARNTRYPVDMRMVVGESDVRAVRLPVDVRDRLLALMSRLGLRYGAVDMRLTADAEYVFLEVNPAGQWQFVEQRTGLPIADAIADELVRLESLPAGADPGSPRTMGAMLAAAT
jgi:glutathione synthase/RimK-type ligase-like ATP-grasp enzyme